MTSTTLRFLAQAIREPRAIASILPSGKALANAMARAVPNAEGRVVELGPGTGPVTQALLDRGIAPENLLAVELNRSLAQDLRKRHPQVRVAMADAGVLPFLLRDLEWGLPDAIVSSLGLRAMPKDTVMRIAGAIHQSLNPGGVLIQYSYAPSSPIPLEICERLGWDIEPLGDVWLNLPPATIYRYRKR